MPTPAAQERVNLLGLERPALDAFVQELGSKPFRARQLMSWIYKRGEGDFAAMTDLAKTFRAQLAGCAEIRTPEIISEQRSADGTRKWLLRAEPRTEPRHPSESRDPSAIPEEMGPGLRRSDGKQRDGEQAIEMVFIPEDDRGTLCISSQVGCVLDCSFCSTAQQGFNRNLTTAEIIGQVWLAKRELGEFTGARGPLAPSVAGDEALARERIVTNVVFMGMGEPLANFRNVIPALRILTDDLGFDLSRRRVTLSTSGLVPQMYKLAEEVNIALAVSLHAPDDALRNELVPINRKHPIAELLEACWHYNDEQNGRSVTFEYVMLDGINDSIAQARQLARLMKGHPAKMNLIPFNPFPGTGYRRSPPHVIRSFRDELIKHGVLATIRRTRGDDIDAACGQLAGRVIDRTTVRLGDKVFGLAVQA